MSAARTPWGRATPELTLAGFLRGEGKGWRVTKFHFQAAQKTRCEQTAPRRRDPAICCRGAAEKRRGSRRARRGQGSTSNPTEGVPGNVWKMSSRLPRCVRGISAPTEGSVSSRFTHFTWHLSLVLQMLRCISDRAPDDTAVWTHVHFPLNKPQK